MCPERAAVQHQMLARRRCCNWLKDRHFVGGSDPVSTSRYVARLSGSEHEAAPITAVIVAVLRIIGGAVLRKVRRSGG